MNDETELEAAQLDFAEPGKSASVKFTESMSLLNRAQSIVKCLGAMDEAAIESSVVADLMDMTEELLDRAYSLNEEAQVLIFQREAADICAAGHARIENEPMAGGGS